MTKCPDCGKEFKEVKKKVKLKVVLLTEKDEEFIRESNKIEGEYSQEAFEDACDAYRWAYRNIVHEINLEHIKEIHKILMKRLEKRIAGKFRTVQVGVMTKNGFKEAIPHWDVKERLNKICHDWNILVRPIRGEDVWKDILVKNWHIRFEKIHPFEDGNGRVGRILMNVQRAKIGLPILTIHQGKEQQEYYKWFSETGKGVVR